jgi:hypothetical protein
MMTSAEIPSEVGRVPIQYWNWKAATLSAAGRAPIFLVTTCTYGWRAVTVAVTAEALYRAGSAGFFAAVTQALRNRRPRWLTMLLVAVLIPAISLVLDCLLHLFLGTPNLTRGMLVSTLVSVVTSVFNWYSMRRGTLLVGRTGVSFVSDLCCLPQLVLQFLLEPLLWMGRLSRRLFAGREI